MRLQRGEEGMPMLPWSVQVPGSMDVLVATPMSEALEPKEETE